MNRHRTLLSGLLGLMLLLQGFAVSAAPHARLADASNLPCHGQMAMTSAEAGKAAGSCCNSTCPDMAGCAQGTMALPAAFSLALSPVSQAQPSFAPVRVLTRTFALPLRPPITLHG